MTGQMALPVGEHDAPTFRNFIVSPRNRLAVKSLQQMIASPGFGLTYLWGAPSSGRSHLLQAACEAMADSIYVPLTDVCDMPSEAVLADLECNALVAVDDLDTVLGNADWERGLFDLYNRCLGADVGLLVSATCAPAHLNVDLPDLKSRLTSGLSLQVHVPDDTEKSQILIERAHLRGMQMDAAVASYILTRCGRDMGELMSLLDRLDAVSLRDQRKLSVPFVRQIVSP